MGDYSVGRELDGIRVLVADLRSDGSDSSRKDAAAAISEAVDRLEARLGLRSERGHANGTTVRAYTGDIVFTERADGSWQVDTKDYPRLDRTLGRAILVPLAQLFIWADRVESITHLLYLNDVVVPHRSISQQRNQHFLAWSTIGALYEASEALRLLRRAGIERLIPNSSTWLELDALRVRWRDRDPFRALRNLGAFHAEPGPILRAMDHWVRRDRRRTLVHSASKKAVDGSLAAGTELFITGLGASRHRMRFAIEQLFRDHGTISDQVRRLFAEVLQAKGLMLSS